MAEKIIGTASVQFTLSNQMNSATDTPLIPDASSVFTPFMRWMSEKPISARALSMRMPIPAPKYPP